MSLIIKINDKEQIEEKVLDYIINHTIKWENNLETKQTILYLPFHKKLAALIRLTWLQDPSSRVFSLLTTLFALNRTAEYYPALLEECAIEIEKTFDNFVRFSFNVPSARNQHEINVPIH